jgi:hypothetical protein
MLVLRTLVLLARGAALRLPILVVPHRPGIGLMSCDTRRYMQRCRQDPLLGVAMISMSMLDWTLSLSPRLP